MAYSFAKVDWNSGLEYAHAPQHLYNKYKEKYDKKAEAALNALIWYLPSASNGMHIEDVAIEYLAHYSALKSWMTE